MTLEQMGIDVRADHWDPAHAGKITKIRLPFTPTELLDVCHSGGDLLPSCCGKISAMRDIVIGTLRDGGWIDVKDLGDLVSLARDHDGPVVYGPWEKVCAAWDAVAGRAAPALPPLAKDPTDFGDATVLLSNAALRFWLGGLGGAPWPAREGESDEERAHRERGEAHRRLERAVDRTRALLLLRPALHTVWSKLADMWPDPVEGFAAVLSSELRWKKGACERDIRTDDLGFGIIDTVGGLAVRADAEAINDLIKGWSETWPDAPNAVTVKRIRVSKDCGIEVIE